MPWANELLRSLTLPNDASTGDARLFLGSELPDILVTELDAVAGIIFYSGFQSDDEDYYFIVAASPGDSLNEIYYGYVRNATEVHIVQYSYATIIPGPDEDEILMSLESDIIDIGLTAGIVIVRGAVEFTGETTWPDDDAAEVVVASISAGWATTAGYCTVRRRNKTIFVRWDLLRTGANLAANIGSSMFTLDAKYRPAVTISFAVGGNVSTGTYGRAFMASTGVMTIQNHAGITTNQRTAGSAMWIID